MLGGADNPNGELLSYIIGANRYQHSKLEGADLSRGDIEIYPGSVFCRMSDRIWGMSTELKDVDIESFVVTQWDYAEDKHGQFYRNRRLDDTNYA